MPRWLILTLSVLLALALIPLVLVTRAHMTHSRKPRIHIMRDLDKQPRFESQQANPLFADHRAMRPPVPGAVPRGAPDPDGAFYIGKVNDEWVRELPVPASPALLQRGRERFGIYCTPCHGLSGDGDGTVSQRAKRLQEKAWTPPPAFHADHVKNRLAGYVFHTITHGIRKMPAYGSQIPVRDRWAIVGYVQSLQQGGNASAKDVPADFPDPRR